MMDEKKIEEAAREHSANASGDYIAATEAEEGFKAGAHWAIQEFLKDLWHDASEEPSKEKPNLLVRDTSGYPSSTNTKCMFNNTRWVSYSAMWKEYTEFLDVEKWLYIDDLLEQKGGE